MARRVQMAAIYPAEVPDWPSAEPLTFLSSGLEPRAGLLQCKPEIFRFITCHPP
jgi:hypothetical protein